MSDEGAWRPGAAVPPSGAPAISPPWSPSVNGASASGETTLRSAGASGLIAEPRVHDLTTQRGHGRMSVARRRRPVRGGVTVTWMTERVGPSADQIDPFGGSESVDVPERVRESQVGSTGPDGANVGFVPNLAPAIRAARSTDCDRPDRRTVMRNVSRDFYVGELWTARPDRDKLAYRYEGRSRGSGT